MRQETSTFIFGAVFYRASSFFPSASRRLNPAIFLRLLGSFLVTRRFTEKFMMEREVREAYSNTNQGIAVPWRRMYRVGHARAKWLFRWISWEYHGCLGPIEDHGHIPREYHQSWFIYQCLMGQSSKIRHCP